MKKRNMCDQEIKRRYLNGDTNFTRRQLLGAGLLSGLTYVAFPNFLQEMFRIKSAMAGNPCIPVIQIYCSGGPGMQRLNAGIAAAGSTAFSVNGILPTATAANTSQVAGMTLFTSGHQFPAVTVPSSPIVTGAATKATTAGGNPVVDSMKMWATPATQALMSGFSVSVASADDAAGASDPEAFLPLLTAAGMSGTVAPFAGTSQSPGGIPAAVLGSSTTSGLFASSVQSFINASSAAGAVTSVLSSGQVIDLMNSIESLSNSQMSQLASLPNAAQVQLLVNNSNQQNVSLATTPKVVDGRTAGTNSAAAVNVTTATSPTSSDAIFATGLNMVGQGFLGGFSFTVNNCDYHGTAITNVATIDAQIGAKIGQAAQFFATEGIDGIIVVQANGAVSFDSSGNAAGDDGGLSSATVFHVAGSSKKAAALAAPFLGGVAANGAANTTLIPNVATGMSAIVWNILLKSGNQGLVSSLLPNFTLAQQKQFTAFG